jgi:hypothetical protein
MQPLGNFQVLGYGQFGVCVVSRPGIQPQPRGHGCPTGRAFPKRWLSQMWV